METVQAKLSKNICLKSFFLDVHLQLSNYSKKQETEIYLATFNATLK